MSVLRGRNCESWPFPALAVRHYWYIKWESDCKKLNRILTSLLLLEDRVKKINCYQVNLDFVSVNDNILATRENIRRNTKSKNASFWYYLY